MVELDEEALVNARARSRDRKAFEPGEARDLCLRGQRRLQAPVLARVFDVNPNAIYYHHQMGAHRGAQGREGILRTPGRRTRLGRDRHRGRRSNRSTPRIATS